MESRQPLPSYLPGLDSLRLIAMGLITWQHIAALQGGYLETLWRGISPGQLGVGLFCTLSGYLAFRLRPDKPDHWFKKRLLTLYPAYWLVTVMAFALTLLFQNDKNITWGLFISQLLGTGFFTHGWGLINVVSWFISLILLCYLLTWLIYRFLPIRPALLALLLITSTMLETRLEVGLTRHLFGFMLAGLLSTYHSDKLLWPVGLLCMGLGLWHYPAYFYAGFGLIALFSALRWVDRNPWPARAAAGVAYPYFLVHGIFLSGMVRFIANPWFAIPLALLCAIGTAWYLNYLQRRVFQR